MHLAKGRLFVLFALCLAVDKVYSARQGFIRPNFPFNLLGPYCSRPSPGQEQCCDDRNDDCSRSIYGTLCYCDTFCGTEGLDCCPDYRDVCTPDNGFGSGEPEELKGYCPEMDNGMVLEEGESARDNCNLCTCLKADNSKLYLQCERDTCLIRPSFISQHNSNPNSGWTATNYTEDAAGLDFFGKKLNWGLKHKLGVLKPKLTQTHNLGTLGKQIPRDYDLRYQGHGVSTIRNQGDCGASWAYAIAALLTDKIRRSSAGQMKEQVSAQHLIDCNRRGQLGCNGGHVDRAAMFIKNRGGVSEKCYPEKFTQEPHCPANLKYVLSQETVDCGNGTSDKPISSSIPYRVAQGRRIDVNNIQVEMMARGSVIALMRVHSDFYMYKDGIYRHDPYKAIPEKDHPTAYHAVRIVGWGDDREGTKYWICANSWGTSWGENGYFRIVRGENHSDIEKYVIAIGNINYNKTLLSRKFLAEHRRTRLMRHLRRIRSAFNL